MVDTYKQPQAMTDFLRQLLTDPFNAYCIDCTNILSTHVNISHGTFICSECAAQHLEHLGMDKTYIKPIFEDLWDSY
jgi:hypothetical protein